MRGYDFRKGHVYAVRRRYPVLGVVFGVLAVAVFGVLGVAAGFVAIVLLLLGGAMDELTPGEGLSSLHEGSDVNGLCSLFLPL